MQRLGRYEIGRLLGAGGQGRVYDAVLCGPGDLRKPVALKVLEGGAGLQREAQIGGLLRHRNLVDVYEVGEVDGTWFIAMERCDGTLSDHLPLSPRAVVQVGLQVCDALLYAHAELGLVHQDLKPANLLFVGDTIKVADLGLAHAEGFDQRPGVRGTRGYMSPEQRAAGAIDHRSDLYALGVVLEELATGHHDAPHTYDFDGEPDDARPRGPDWLEPIVARCLAADPEDRFETAAALRRALQALDVQGAPLALPAAAPTPPAERTAPAPPIGRDAVLARLRDALGAPGLVTLRGTAGMGKTTVARALLAGWPGQGWFVELAAVTEAAGLVVRVGQALGLPDLPADTDDGRDRVGRALAAHGVALLVLDNFEQLWAHRDAVVAWCDRATDLRVLVTSRRTLRARGERVIDLAPLAPHDAVALLVRHARERGVDVQDDPALPELARRLEGIPLALELAAGRIGVLSAMQVLQRLGLSLLRSSDPDRPERQTTLARAIAWSWADLDARERQALAQLSVFRAPFTVEAAEAVLALDADGPWALDVLDLLADRSLLAVRDHRLRLLEPVREFAATQLSDPEVARRHAHWFARLGTLEGLEALDGHGGLERFRALEAQLPDLLAACDWARAAGDDDAAALTCLAATQALRVRGATPDAQHVLDGVLPGATSHLGPLRMRQAQLQLDVHHPSCVEQARAARTAYAGRELRGDEPFTLALLEAGCLGVQSQHDEAAAAYRAGRARARAVSRPLWEGRFLSGVAMYTWRSGQPHDAREMLETSVALAEATGDWRTRGQLLMNLSNLLAACGEPDRAFATAHACREHFQQTGGHVDEPNLLGNLAAHAQAVGDIDGAVQRMREAHELAERRGGRRVTAGLTQRLAKVYADLGHWHDAEHTFEVAIRQWTELDAPAAAARCRVLLAAMRAQLGDPEGSEAAVQAAQRACTPELERHWIDVQLAIASIQGSWGASEAAVQTLRATSTHSDPSGWTHTVLFSDLGVALERAGHDDEAVGHLDTALAQPMAPWHPRARVLALSARARLGNRVPAHRHPDDLDTALDIAAAPLHRALAFQGRFEVTGDPADRAEAQRLFDALDVPAHAPLRRGIEEGDDPG